MLEAWLTLMQQCPRHFRLAKSVLEGLATYALPAAGGHYVRLDAGFGLAGCLAGWAYAA